MSSPRRPGRPCHARANHALASFHLQWLELSELGSLKQGPDDHRLFTPQLASEMRDETALFDVFREADDLDVDDRA